MVGKPLSLKKSDIRHFSDPLSIRSREQLEQFISMQGRRPRILMGRLEGRKRDRLLKMAANYFGDLGFDVDISLDGLTPEWAVKMAVENDVHIICLTDINAKDVSPLKLIHTILRETCSENIRIIGIGDVSCADRNQLIQTGLSDIFAWGPKFSESVGKLINRLVSIDFARPSPGKCIAGVLAQDRCMIAKTISIIESKATEHRAVAQKIIEGLYPHTGDSVRIGVTGIPGAGKSTFIESFGLQLLAQGHRVAVLAIDPSSSISGGSLLGDKTRMGRLSADSRAFIRPSPSSGVLGGVAGKTRETMMVCEAAGYDVILVETVGVGQTEIAVASMVDFFLLLLVAGAGDRYQGIKKGIIEMVDAIVITKADGDNIENANAAQQEYTKALSLLRPASPLWRPPVVTCSAHDPKKVKEVWRIISQYVDRFSDTGGLTGKRARQSVDWMLAMVDQGLMHQFHKNPQVGRILDSVLRAIETGNISAEEAAQQLLEAYDAPVG
jgi:LAO/AO transport system kinase